VIIDTNVYLSRWPFRRLNGDTTDELVAKLRRVQVTQAWAGSFDALLHRDLADVNRRLADECRTRGGGLLVPIGCVNPMLPDWEEDLRRCHEVHRMPGIRLHPNYHGYKLDEPAFVRVLRAAADRGLIVQLAVIMEDERTQHPLVRVSPVDVAPLLQLLATLPKLRLVLLNCFRALRPEAAKPFAAAGQVYFEISMLESVGGVAKLLDHVPVDRVLFGSYAPFFYADSAHLKLRESDLNETELNAIRAGNAASILKL
jgi:predicted TIM-barrel fold metal-dependent hydrolase